MNKWQLVRSRQHLTLRHTNLVDGTVFDCGELRLDTPEAMVVDWIVHQPASRPGDLIQLPSRVLTLGAEARA